MPDWSAIYEEHVEAVYQFLYNMLGNKHDAQDVTQETFVKAFHKLDSFDYHSKLRTWLIAIGRNLAIDRIRRNQRGAVLLGVFQREQRTEPDSSEQLIQSETRAELLSVIRTLNPDYRTIVILKMQDFTSAEIATILNWNEGKVRVGYHRAIKMLRKRMTRDGGVHVEFI